MSKTFCKKTCVQGLNCNKVGSNQTVQLHQLRGYNFESSGFAIIMHIDYIFWAQSNKLIQWLDGM